MHLLIQPSVPSFVLVTGLISGVPAQIPEVILLPHFGASLTLKSTSCPQFYVLLTPFLKGAGTAREAGVPCAFRHGELWPVARRGAQCYLGNVLGTSPRGALWGCTCLASVMW